jgi:hypothetical protein
MVRILTHLALSVTTVAAMAQWPGGPLTISAARSQGTHAHTLSSRGGTPYNDLCQNAVVQTLPPDGSITITGDNTGSTDTEDFGNPVSWEAFWIDTCATVTVSYCGTDPLFELVYSILIVGCPDFIANVQNNGTEFCGDGNVTITYESLPAGTYYVPVLRIAGAEGPYTMTVTSDVCDTPPLNDICANATPLLVVQDCALGIVAGNNANAVINTWPPCASTTSQFQDVWYQFDSGTNTEVTITIDPGTIGDIGVEVRDDCAGSSIFCAVGDTTWTVAVEPGTNYHVRVFSNNDFGFGGTFGICVTPPTGLCDAGTVTIAGGGTVITACTNGGDPIGFTQETASGATLALILTDAEDTIVSLLGGNVLFPAGLTPGEYHVWGLSYDGDLMSAEAGLPLSGISGTGSCLDLSAAPVTVTVEICEGLQDIEAPGWDFAVMATPDGPYVRWQGDQQQIGLEFFDARGSLLVRRTFMVQPGQGFPPMPQGTPAPGLYTVRVSGPGGPPLVKRVFVH